MKQIESLVNLIEELSKLPGVGERSATRLAHYILRNRQHFAGSLAQALTDVKDKIHLCENCFSYAEEQFCYICEDLKRSEPTICVVEEASDIMKLEKSGRFRGRYHVLHGAIAPMKGIGPSDLKINELIRRIQDSPVNEVILALDADLEGDTTALYIAKMLEGHKIKVTRLAHGIPIGGDLEYIDQRTIGRAFENRVEL
ncbi:MAG: recombination mediator RecR [Bdellovibrionales bacterium]